MLGKRTPMRKRPVLVWGIFLFYLIVSILGIVQIFFVTAGGVAMTPEQQAYLEQFSVMDRVVGYGNAAVTLAGVTLLFGLRQLAVKVLALAFFLNVFTTTVVWIRTDPASVIAPAGLALQAGGIALFGLVVLYAWRLGKRGLLA